jgi:hypothetical protein
MPDVWKGDELLLFLAFFIPGFIALQVYGLFVSIDDSDIVKRLPAVIAYSAIHYAFTGWVILVAPEGPARTMAAYVVVLVLPIFWAPAVLLARDWERWRHVMFSPRLLSRALKPEASPWDRVFNGRAWWVRIKLKDGVRVGGYLGPGSLTSCFPRPEQLFIKDAFTVEQGTGAFQNAAPGTGLLVNGSEISIIELTEVRTS